jgi:hypothetical protein
MKRRPVSPPLILVALLAILVTGTALARTPEVVDDGTDRVIVHGAVELHRTAEPVSSLRTGGDPSGIGLFVVWDEAGRRWGTTSRDGGATWARARPVRVGLELRDATVHPLLAASAKGRLHLVRFPTVSLPEWRKALDELGFEVLSYFPNNAHIVRADPSRLDQLRDLEFVEQVQPYHPSYRIDPELRRDLLEQRVTGELRVRVQVFEWGPAAKERVLADASALGVRVADYWSSGHVLELWAGRDAIFALAAHDDVLWIERWTEPGADMDLVREDAGSNFVHDTFGYCGNGVAGEVMDLGIQADHPDFDGVILHGNSNIDSHGTSTYGIVFGNGDLDGDGDGKALGHLPCAQGIFADQGEFADRFLHTQELKQAPYFASFQTNSWGGGLTQSYTTVSQDMDDIIWRLDFAILNSQSNNGDQSSRPEAWAKNVISVGGIRHYNTLDTSDDSWGFGASIGPAADGRIKPDVSYWYDFIYTTTTGSGYTPGFGGTSAATPESAGVLGLLVEMWADNVWGTNPSGATAFDKQPHASTLKALLINNSQQYDFTGAGSDLGRFKQGWGRPSARVAYERAANSFVVDETDLLELNDTATYFVDVEPGETELKVTLVYPDPPGTTSAAMHRINDVNLRVTSPAATLYYGNAGLEDGTASTTGGSPDALNTVENVFVVSPQSGTWTVEVEAVEVNQDAHLDTAQADVAFALVVTGGRAVYTSGQGLVDTRPDQVSCTDTIELTVRDGNVGASLNVAVSSGTETVAETVALSETDAGSGIYTGQVSVVGTPPAVDGAISVNDGDAVTIEYVDANDGAGGMNVVVQSSAVVDCATPQISGVWVSDLTDTEATISWVTDEPSNSSVTWGNAVPPTQTEARAGHVAAHNLRLTGLAECTSYFFSVGSEDPVGNVSTDDNGGSFYLFTTMTRTAGQLHSCREGTIVLEAEFVGCNASVPIRLTDSDLDLDPGLSETVEVFVSSTTESQAEPVTLTEDGLATGVFIGFIPTAGGAPAADGVLQLADGDWITGRYVDPDDGTGVPLVSLYTIEADCAGPRIDPITVDNLTDSGATVRWTASEDATGFVEWGTTPALGSQAASSGSATSHGVGVGTFAECARVFFRVSATDRYANTSVSPIHEFNIWGVPGIYHVDDFEADLGWTLNGEWEIDAPQGLGSAPGDPAAAFSGTQVLGHDLSGLGTEPGDYEPLANESASSPVIDASSFTDTEIKLRRRLNVAQGSFAYIDVRNAGGSWVQVYGSPVSGVSESGWVDMVFNIASLADGNANLQVRFRERSHLASSFASGWNIDDLTLRDSALPAIGACGACAGAPAFSGLISAADDDPCADSGVTLTWSPAHGWGTGSGGSYAIYRDTTAGFTPGPGNLIASGIAGTQWTDPAVPDDTDVHYLVLAESDESCSSGPANGGVTDANTAYVTTRDATTQAAPADVGATLLVGAVADAHARLNWSPAAGAAAYRIYRSGQPDVNFTLQAQIAPTLFDDIDVMADGQIWYYRVTAIDACGNEGP